MVLKNIVKHFFLDMFCDSMKKYIFAWLELLELRNYVLPVAQLSLANVKTLADSLGSVL